MHLVNSVEYNGNLMQNEVALLKFFLITATDLQIPTGLTQFRIHWDDPNTAKPYSWISIFEVKDVGSVFKVGETNASMSWLSKSIESKRLRTGAQEER
jgi:hypothetical protein